MKAFLEFTYLVKDMVMLGLGMIVVLIIVFSKLIINELIFPMLLKLIF